MISAPITPGTHPRQVRRNTISIEPQPRSYTASGGKIIANSTRKQDIAMRFSTIQLQSYKKILNYANIFAKMFPDHKFQTLKIFTERKSL